MTTPFSTALGAEFLIVGAGSAGCALAYRLAEAGREVLLLEHGGADGNAWLNWHIHMPAALSYPMNMPRYDWGYRTEPEAQLGRRRLACPRGKVWGGSSSINGMVYVRGHRQDFDYWAASGAKGWSGAEVQPYYQRMETVHGDVDAHWRGTAGPVHITRAAAASPLQQAFLTAGEEAGFARTADYNGAEQEGFCHFDQTIANGVRQSAARAYLRPALARPNLRIVRARALRVLFSGDRATGVEAQCGGQVQQFAATGEVILAASAINSPQLLLLSGIGDEAALKALGIPVRAHRPGVGRNLQDHLELYVQQACKRPVTLNGSLNWFSKGCIGAQWLLARRGAGASNHFECGAFLRSQGAEYPDFQFHFLPAAIRYDGRGAASGHGFQAHVGHMRAPARGQVWLESADPLAAPRIHFNYLASAGEWEKMREAIRTVRAVFAQPAMAEFCGSAISPDGEDDAALDDAIREHAESAYHPCGTCRMGAEEDAEAVVNPQCSVLGVHNLRVVDSSIFPRIPYGNLNAPSMMVGEKAADHILARPPLPPAATP